MIAIGLSVLLPLVAAQPDLAAMTGDGGVGVFVGNGNLTAGLTRYGQLALFRWPSPGYYDQVQMLQPPDVARRPDQGGIWGVETANYVEWLFEDPALEPRWERAPIGLAALSMAGQSTGRSYALEAFVAFDPGVLALRLNVGAQSARPRVFWYANFAPCTRLIPELPVGDWLLDRYNDFAVFATDDGAAMVHFRPKDPSAAEWERALRMLRENRTPSEWGTFPAGSYIVYGAQEPVVGFHCGREDSPSSAFGAVAAGRLQKIATATGACDAALELIPESDRGAYSATIFAAAASTMSDAYALVQRARDIGYAQLREDTVRAWEQRLDGAQFPAGLPEDVTERCREALAEILICTDEKSGAIVRSPATQPPLALVWSRCAVWTSLALDAVGMPEAAQRNLEALADSIYAEADGTMLGAMPAAIYSNGVPAFPRYVNDIENNGWILWSCMQHAGALSSDARRQWLDKVWPKLRLAADFLASWVDARDGAPLHSFNWRTLHEDQRPRAALVTFLGMDAAIRMASEVHFNVPEAWLRRRGELDLWIQLFHLQHEGQWALEDEGVFWLTEQARRASRDTGPGTTATAGRPILAADDPRWLERAVALLQMETASAAQLRDAAWLTSTFSDRKVTFDRLQNSSDPFHDSVEAANYILAALAMTGLVPSADAPVSP